MNGQHAKAYSCYSLGVWLLLLKMCHLLGHKKNLLEKSLHDLSRSCNKPVAKQRIEPRWPVSSASKLKIQIDTTLEAAHLGSIQRKFMPSSEHNPENRKQNNPGRKGELPWQTRHKGMLKYATTWLDTWHAKYPTTQHYVCLHVMRPLLQTDSFEDNERKQLPAVSLKIQRSLHTTGVRNTWCNGTTAMSKEGSSLASGHPQKL